MKFRNKIRGFFMILTKHSAPYWVRGSVQSSAPCSANARLQSLAVTTKASECQTDGRCWRAQPKPQPLSRNPGSRVLSNFCQQSHRFRWNHPCPVGGHHRNDTADVCQRMRFLHDQRVRQVRSAAPGTRCRQGLPTASLFPLLLSSKVNFGV